MVSGVLSIPLSGRGLGSRDSSADSRRFPLRRFVAGEENQLAAVAIANLLDGLSGNDASGSERLGYGGPLVFHGASGTGKSHLAIGLARQFKQRSKSARVIYAAAVDLSRRLDDEPSEQPYRGSNWFTGVSLLVIDDVQQLVGKVDVQHQLVRILDTVSQSGGRVVVTSQSSPVRQTKLIAPLRSRLCSGLVVRLVKPAAASRRVIVREIATSRGFLLDTKAINKLASQLDGTVPQLIGAIVQLQVRSQAKGYRFDQPRGQQAATDADEIDQLLREHAKTSQVTIHQIATLSAKYFGMTLVEMRSSSRKRNMVTARGVAIYLARQLTDDSLEQLGHYFGGRDHTTILHSFQKINRLSRDDDAIGHAIKEVRQRLHKN